MWNPLEKDKTKQKRILPQTGSVRTLSLLPDKQFLAAANGWNREIIVFPKMHSYRVESLSFSPNGRYFASADRSGKIIICSTEVRNLVKICVTGRMRLFLVADLRATKGYRIDAHLFLFISPFFLFPSIFFHFSNIKFSPVQELVIGTRASRGCNSTR